MVIRFLLQINGMKRGVFMNLGTARIDFMDGYFSTNDRQPKTHAAYKSDLLQFELFIGSDVDVRSLNATLIEHWAADLKSHDYSPASIRRKLVVLKVFFGYWVRSGVLFESPFWRVRISFGKVFQLPRSLTEAEVKDLLQQAHHPFLKGKVTVSSEKFSPSSKAFLYLRNKAIIELLFATGIRVGELSSINLDDFITDESAFRIRGKGRKERLAFLVDQITRQAHEDHFKARKRLETSSAALFVNSSGGRLSPQGISNVLRSLRKSCGIARHITPHMLRHTVATFLLRNGADIRIVQEFLGHASIATTQKYTHIAKEHLITELRARHPSLAMRA